MIFEIFFRFYVLHKNNFGLRRLLCIPTNCLKSLDKKPKICYNIIMKGKKNPNIKSEVIIMKHIFENWQNRVIRKYGFENWRTVLVFRLTSPIH